MNIGAVFHRHVPFVRDVKQSFVAQTSCRRKNTCGISPGDEPFFHVCEDAQLVKTSCHKTDTDAVSPSYGQLSRDHRQSGVMRMTCRRKSTRTVSASDELHVHACCNDHVPKTFCHNTNKETASLVGVPPAHVSWHSEQ